MSKPGKAVLLASPESLREEPFGVVHSDSLDPPFEPGVPWLSGLSVAVAFMLGSHGWHWSWALVVFWVVVYHERRRLSHVWAELRREADGAALLAPSRGKDGTDWLNHTLRALWPVFERGMSGYVLSKLVKSMGDAGKVRIGGLQLGEVRIKDLCFGWPAEGDPLPPLYLISMQAVEKSEARGADGARAVRVVLKADARFAPPTRAAGGAKPGALLLQMKLLEPIGVGFEVGVTNIRMEGTLLLELEFVEPYPWLGNLSLSFVQDPSVAFEIELAAANLTDLIPALKRWLRETIRAAVREAMVSPHRFVIPLYAWYGDKPAAAAAAAFAAAMAAGATVDESLGRSFLAAEAASASPGRLSPLSQHWADRAAAASKRAAEEVWKSAPRGIGNAVSPSSPPTRPGRKHAGRPPEASGSRAGDKRAERAAASEQERAAAVLLQRQSRALLPRNGSSNALSPLGERRSAGRPGGGSHAGTRPGAHARAGGATNGGAGGGTGAGASGGTSGGTGGGAQPAIAPSRSVALVVRDTDFFGPNFTGGGGRASTAGGGTCSGANSCANGSATGCSTCSSGSGSSGGANGGVVSGGSSQSRCGDAASRVCAGAAAPAASSSSSPKAERPGTEGLTRRVAGAKRLLSHAKPAAAEQGSKEAGSKEAGSKDAGARDGGGRSGGRGGEARDQAASSGGGVYPTMHADDFFRVGTGGIKPSASYPHCLGGESTLPPNATERRAMTVDGCSAPRGEGGAMGQEGSGAGGETRSSSSSSLASLGWSGRVAEPPPAGVGSPVGLLLHLARGTPAERASAEAQLRAGIAVLRLRVVSLVNLVSERDANLSSHLAPALRVTAAVAAREATAAEAQKGTLLNASSARLAPWPVAASLGAPGLQRPTVHVPVMQDFWLPVHDVSTQRLWIVAKVKEALEEPRLSSGSVGLADLVFGVTVSRAVPLGDGTAAAQIELTLDLNV